MAPVRGSTTEICGNSITCRLGGQDLYDKEVGVGVSEDLVAGDELLSFSRDIHLLPKHEAALNHLFYSSIAPKISPEMK